MNESTGNKIAAFVYVNMNPITPQETHLVECAKEWARLNNADLVVYSPMIQNHSDYPLTFEEKSHFIKENLGFDLNPSNSLYDALQDLHSNEYVKAKVFVPTEMKFVAEQLAQKFNYSVSDSQTTDNNQTRKEIIEHILKRIYIGEEFQNHEEYFSLLSQRCMVNLKEDKRFSETKHNIKVGDTVEHIPTGDIATVKSIGKRIFCESLISGVPEWYSPYELVNTTGNIPETMSPVFSDLVSDTTNFNLD